MRLPLRSRSIKPLALLLALLVTSGCIAVHPDHQIRQRIEWGAVDRRIGDADDRKTQKNDSPLFTSELGSEKATLTGVFTGDLDWSPPPFSLLLAMMNRNRVEFEQRESIPYQTDSEAILDFATLTKRDPETCIELTLQTERAYDRSIEALSPELRIDGQLIQDVRIERETTNDMQLWYTVRFYFVFTIERLFDVVARNAILCAPRIARESVELKLSNDLYPIDPKERWTLRFAWSLDDPNLRPPEQREKKRWRR